MGVALKRAQSFSTWSMQCLHFSLTCRRKILPLITEGLRQRTPGLEGFLQSEACHSRLYCLQRQQNAGTNISRAHIAQTCICETGCRARCRCSTFATPSGLLFRPRTRTNPAAIRPIPDFLPVLGPLRYRTGASPGFTQLFTPPPTIVCQGPGPPMLQRQHILDSPRQS